MGPLLEVHRNDLTIVEVAGTPPSEGASGEKPRIQLEMTISVASRDQSALESYARVRLGGCAGHQTVVILWPVDLPIPIIVDSVATGRRHVEINLVRVTPVKTAGIGLINEAIVIVVHPVGACHRSNGLHVNLNLQ